MDHLELDHDLCRGRQQRLLDAMQSQRLDLVVVQRPEHIQWLTGARFPWVLEAFTLVASDGRTVLVVPDSQRPETAAADDVIDYPAQPDCTLRNDQRAAASNVLQDRLNSFSAMSRVGLEFSVATRHLDWSSTETVDVEPDLFRLRRRKDPDELAMIRRAIAATEAMYARAREIIEPGVEELFVFNELQSVAVETCGEMLTRTGNDYQCGSPGGPPRSGRRAAAGELYILDLGPAYRGYFADNARTIAVTEPTDEQFATWEQVTQVFPIIEETVRPGVSARQLYDRVKQLLDDAPIGHFPHHLGHGIGLFPHEAPHLNPFWDDVFEVGDVFTVEPGLYADRLRGGMRIENDYLVTEDGVECLTTFPLELTVVT